MNTPQQSEYQLLNLVTDELESATRELDEALAAVGAKRRPLIRGVQASRLNDRDLGEHILQDWYSAASEDVVMAAHNEGYRQAVNDIHTLIQAYYKGLT